MTAKEGDIGVLGTCQIRNICLFVCLIVVHSWIITFDSPLVSLFVGCIELFFVLYALFCKSIGEFSLIYIVLLSVSMESNLYIFGDRSRVMYSFLSLPGLRCYHLIVISILACCKSFRGKVYKKNSTLYTRFAMYSLGLFMVGMLTTVITLVMNDNGILEHFDLFPFIARDYYQHIVILSIIITISSALHENSDFRRQLGTLLENLMIAFVLAAIILVLGGNYYSSNDEWNTTLICSQALFMTTPMMLLMFYRDEKKTYKENKRLRNTFLMLGIASILIQKKYTLGASGIWAIAAIITLLLFIAKLLLEGIRGKRYYFGLISILAIGGILVLIAILLDIIHIHIEENTHTMYKLHTAIKLLFHWQDGIQGWFMGVGSSIQVRIEQLINIWMEYMDKPFYLIFGKGIGGYITHHWGLADWNISGATYPDPMIFHELYGAMHTGIAEVFLNFGFVGLISSIWIGIKSIQVFFSKKSNAWLLLGVLWLYAYYTVYFSLALGVGCLCYGISLLDKDNDENTKIICEEQT